MVEFLVFGIVLWAVAIGAFIYMEYEIRRYKKARKLLEQLEVEAREK